MVIAMSFRSTTIPLFFYCTSMLLFLPTALGVVGTFCFAVERIVKRSGRNKGKLIFVTMSVEE